jgi:hypothetical protein
MQPPYFATIFVQTLRNQVVHVLLSALVIHSSENFINTTVP